jgi:hypothetical protein
MKTLTELRSEFNSDEEFGKAILLEVEGLAKANPDYVYEPNVVLAPIDGHIFKDNVYSYTCGANDSKGCLIGQALQKLGVFLEEKNTSFRTILLIYNSNMNFDKSPSLDALCKIQNRQDGGLKWGDCLEDR